MKLFCSLEDQSGKEGSEVRCCVVASSRGIFIHANGYGEKDSNPDSPESYPIMVEFYENRLRVLVWGDINSEDYTHAIDLENARESCRIQ